MAEAEEPPAHLRPDWMPNNASIHCLVCKTPFSFTLRRHHCRACGNLVCSTCCGSWVTLPRGFGYNKPQRVCRHCLKSLEKEKQQEDEVAQQSEMVTLAAQFYLRDKPFQYLTVLSDIGRLKPPTKNFVEVSSADEKELLMTCSFRKSSMITSEPIRSCFASLFNSIQHPYILPSRTVDFVVDKKICLAIRPFSRDGSLRDKLYRVVPKTPYHKKYGTGSNSYTLNAKQAALYGRQILEALSFLRSLRFPYPQLHAANVILYQDKCCLADLESSIIGLPPFHLPHMDTFTSPEVICFGHVLFQMCAGFSLGKTALQDHVNKLPKPVYEILQKIFTPSPPVVTVDQLLKDPFFAGVKITEDMQAPREACQLDKKQKTLLKRARENVKKMIERSCGVGGASPTGEDEAESPEDPPPVAIEADMKSPRKREQQESATKALALGFDEGPTNVVNPNDPLNPENRKKAALRSKMIQKKIKRRTMQVERDPNLDSAKSATISGLVSPRQERQMESKSPATAVKRPQRTTSSFSVMSASNPAVQTRAAAPAPPPAPAAPAAPPPPAAGPPPPPPPSVSLPPAQAGRNALLDSIRDPSNGLKRLKKAT